MQTSSNIPRPTGNRLLVKPLKLEPNHSPQGLVLPENYQNFKDQQRSKVEALSETLYKNSVDAASRGEDTIFVGDIVIHHQQFGYPIPGTDYLLLDVDDVLAKLTSEEPQKCRHGRSLTYSCEECDK